MSLGVNIQSKSSSTVSEPASASVAVDCSPPAELSSNATINERLQRAWSTLQGKFQVGEARVSAFWAGYGSNKGTVDLEAVAKTLLDKISQFEVGSEAWAALGQDIAEVRFLQGDYKKAEKNLEQLLTCGHLNARTYLMLALAESKIGTPQKDAEATRHFEVYAEKILEDKFQHLPNRLENTLTIYKEAQASMRAQGREDLASQFDEPIKLVIQKIAKAEAESTAASNEAVINRQNNIKNLDKINEAIAETLQLVKVGDSNLEQVAVLHTWAIQFYDRYAKEYPIAEEYAKAYREKLSQAPLNAVQVSSLTPQKLNVAIIYASEFLKQKGKVDLQQILLKAGRGEIKLINPDFNTAMLDHYIDDDAVIEK